MTFLRFSFVALMLSAGAYAAAPVAAISASPSSGAAPLGVFFDAGSSSADAQSFLWDFGDGSISTARTVTHIYTVAGTYTAVLTVKNAAGESGSSQVVITVTGSGQGPVSADVNFRWAITSGTFSLKHSQTGRDTLTLNSVFNTVDLPAKLDGLAASFTINNLFTVTGIMGPEGGFESAENGRPDFLIQASVVDQTLTVFISKADLKAALAASGATNTTVPSPGAQVPVNFTMTIGAQTYSITENFTYTSTAGGSGRGQLQLKNNIGSVNDGFFVINQASAIENAEGTGHFFEFNGYLSLPAGKQLLLPGAGNFTVRFNEANPVIILFDRLSKAKDSIVYNQSDRDLNGISRMTIDTVKRSFTIRTWDIPNDPALGGTGLPRRGRPFTAFNFTVRVDFDQPDGSTFQAVTATRLTRKTTDDAFWQTGRRRKRQ